MSVLPELVRQMTSIQSQFRSCLPAPELWLYWCHLFYQLLNCDCIDVICFTSSWTVTVLMSFVLPAPELWLYWCHLFYQLLNCDYIDVICFTSSWTVTILMSFVLPAPELWLYWCHLFYQLLNCDYIDGMDAAAVADLVLTPGKDRFYMLQWLFSRYTLG